jgi:hypothetical protein
MGIGLRVGVRDIVSLVTIALATVAARLAAPGWADAITAGGITLAGMKVASGLFSSVRNERTHGALFEAAFKSFEPTRERPPDLLSLERTFGYGRYEPDEFEAKVKPLLQGICRRIMLDRLGSDLLVDPDRHYRGELARLHPGSREVGSLGTDDIAAIVSAIEAL